MIRKLYQLYSDAKISEDREKAASESYSGPGNRRNNQNQRAPEDEEEIILMDNESDSNFGVGHLKQNKKTLK